MGGAVKLYPLEAAGERWPVFILERELEPTTTAQAAAEAAAIHGISWRATLVWRGHVFRRDGPGPRRCWQCHREYNANYRFHHYPHCKAAKISGLLPVEAAVLDVGVDNPFPEERDESWWETWRQRAKVPGVTVIVRADTVSLPNTVALVELVQLLRHGRGLQPGESAPGWRWKIVFYGWESLPEARTVGGPPGFLYRELPLLSDLLATNFRAEDVEFCIGRPDDTEGPSAAGQP